MDNIAYTKYAIEPFERIGGRAVRWSLNDYKAKFEITSEIGVKQLAIPKGDTLPQFGHYTDHNERRLTWEPQESTVEAVCIVLQADKVV